MTVGELYRVLPNDERVQINQGKDFVLIIEAKNIPAYLLDASIKEITAIQRYNKVTPRERELNAYVKILLCE
jgi:hypothetical protein